MPYRIFETVHLTRMLLKNEFALTVIVNWGSQENLSLEMKINISLLFQHPWMLIESNKRWTWRLSKTTLCMSHFVTSRLSWWVIKLIKLEFNFFFHAILCLFKGRNKDWFLLYYNYCKYCLTQANVTIMHWMHDVIASLVGHSVLI